MARTSNTPNPHTAQTTDVKQQFYHVSTNLLKSPKAPQASVVDPSVLFRSAMDQLCSQFNFDPLSCEVRNEPDESATPVNNKATKATASDKSYAKVLARNRPVTPPGQPLVYGVYLSHIVHSLSREFNPSTQHRVLRTMASVTDLTQLVETNNLQSLPRIQKQLTRGLACYRDRNLPIHKAIVKCLHASQTDNNPFNQKQVRQVAFNSSVMEEPTKHKYFDRDRMAEIQMERCSDLLYVKVQNMHTIPQEYQQQQQDPMNSTSYQSPSKQQKSAVKPQSTPKVILKDPTAVAAAQPHLDNRDKSRSQIDT